MGSLVHCCSCPWAFPFGSGLLRASLRSVPVGTKPPASLTQQGAAQCAASSLLSPPDSAPFAAVGKGHATLRYASLSHAPCWHSRSLPPSGSAPTEWPVAIATAVFISHSPESGGGECVEALVKHTPPLLPPANGVGLGAGFEDYEGARPERRWTRGGDS